MIETAADELVELIELLSLAARIEAGRYDPVVREADSLDLARAGCPGRDRRGRGGDRRSRTRSSVRSPRSRELPAATAASTWP